MPAGQLRRGAFRQRDVLAISRPGWRPGLGAGIVAWGPDSWLRGVATFFGCSLGFDTYFYFLHRGLHLRPLMRFHRLHHLSRVTGPLSAQSVSVVEALGWVVGYIGVPWLLSQVAAAQHDRVLRVPDLRGDREHHRSHQRRAGRGR